MLSKSKNKTKVIYLVRAELTDMVRYVSAPENASKVQILSRARFGLEQTKASSIGNASRCRTNRLWPKLRDSFLKSDSFTIETTGILIKPEDERRLNHIVAALNREALPKAEFAK